MGAAESNPVRNLDKRTARRQYRAAFSSAVSRYRVDDEAHHNSSNHGEQPTVIDDNRPVQCFIRKRPIFQRELKAFEFDVVTCGANRRRCTIHDARMKADMRNRLMTHHEFTFDRVFDENTTNEEVYKETASKLVDLVCEGRFTTCLMYGQTGSGKTYTMSALYEHAAQSLFQKLDQTNYVVSVSFVEIAGDRCNDLFNRFQDAPLLTAQDGLVWPYPIVELDVENSEDLISFVRFGSGVRSTSATGVHDASSRSHAILRIYVKRKKNNGSSNTNSGSTAASRKRWGNQRRTMNNDEIPVEHEFEGVLSLVDLAGSEKNIDSMHHSAQRRKEGAQINASLMALKDCVRARASGKNRSHVYRKSKLTMALKGSFILPTAKTMIIATVSPSSKDTEHSLNTLRHACIMDLTEGGASGASGARRSRSSGGDSTNNSNEGSRRSSISWTENIGEINVSREARILKAQSKHGSIGLQSNGNNGCQKDQHQGPLTGKEIRRQRIQAEKRALSLLTSAQKSLLSKGRESLGANSSTHAQSHRLQRHISPYPQSETQKEELAARDARRAGLTVSPKQKAHVKRVTKKTKSQRSREGLYTMEDVDDLYKQMNNPNLAPGTKKRMQLQLAKALAYVAAHSEEGEDCREENQEEEARRMQSCAHFKRTLKDDFMQQEEEERLQREQELAQMTNRNGNGVLNEFRTNNQMMPSSPQAASLRNSSLSPPTEQQQKGTGSRNRSHLKQQKKNSRGPENVSVRNKPSTTSSSPKKIDRGLAVKERRRKQIEQEQQKLKQKQSRKHKSTPSSNSRDSEIQRLEASIVDPNLSNATKIGLKKQLAKLKAVQIREQRKREQSEREAKRRADADKRRAAQAAARQSNAFDDGVGTSLDNTKQVEEKLKYQQEQQQQQLQLQQLQQQNQYQHQQYQHQQYQQQQYQHQQYQQQSSHYQDSLDRAIAPATQDQYSMQRKIFQNQQQQQSSHFQHSYSSASSAPFATEANYDQQYEGSGRNHTRGYYE